MHIQMDISFYKSLIFFDQLKKQLELLWKKLDINSPNFCILEFHPNNPSSSNFYAKAQIKSLQK